MVIQHNLMALFADRENKSVAGRLKKSTEKLSTGYKINRAADNAAGLAISEKMRKQIRGLTQGENNIEDGIGYVQVADGALEQVHDMLQRMNELSVQAANGTNSPSDREAIDKEIQQLKTEMDRVFQTTKFNETYIWPEERTRIIGIGVGEVQAVTISTPYYQSFTVNNSTYDKVAFSGGYNIKADENGVSMSWVGYNGTDYTTKTIDWNTLKKNNYQFNIGDIFDGNNYPELFENGKPIFDFKVGFSVRKEAQLADIIKAIDGTSMSAGSSASMWGGFEDGTGAVDSSRGIHCSGVSINYTAAYASRANSGAGQGYDFVNGSDSYIEVKAVTADGGNLSQIPNANDVDKAKENTEQWKFEFVMEGIGNVTATSTSITGYANDRTNDDRGLWWQYYYQSTSKYGIGHTTSAKGSGTLGSAMDALTGTKDEYNNNKGVSPGVLNKTLGGAADEGGFVDISFTLTAENPYSYGKKDDGSSYTSQSVGSFVLTVPVSNTDTETTVYERIMESLNSTTIFDLMSSANNSTHYMYQSGKNESKVEVKVYKTENYWPQVDIPIHCGADSTDKLNIRYETMRIRKLGLVKTNVRTEEMALNALDEISDALRAVSIQRAAFGAYQNRLEHAAKINANTSENIQAAESVIRDTDMADEMVKYSNANILVQAGQSMLAQANQSKQGVLNLLG